MPLSYTVEQYIQDLRAIRNTGSATPETSFYRPLDNLLNAVGKSLKPVVLFSSQLRNQGAGSPDGGLFPQPRKTRSTEPPQLQNPERGAVEIKPAGYSLDALTREEQTLRYLRQYGLVFITNYHEFRLLILDASNQPRTVEKYTLARTPDDLWYRPIDPSHTDLLPDFLKRVMLHKVPLTQPKEVAWLLASYAREARARAEQHDLPAFRTVKAALEESLGIQFEGDKGEHFFRSTLVQTLFYGIFSAWVLWRHTPEGRAPHAIFNWRLSDDYLKVPILRKLFREVSDRSHLNTIQLTEILELAGDALNRVQSQLFDIFQGEEAVAYFYEPFLEAFDPQLRKDLGVWYTPKEIVQYQVERVDHLLRTQLNQPLGLASPHVRILDPCCGTGAYLTAVLHRIHGTLLAEAGDDTALVPSTLRTAAITRLFGFEIMPAPFVIAHMEIARLLDDLGAPLTDTQRAGIFLTNALTGWVPEEHPQSVLSDEFRKEREDSEHIKQQGSILVILGNPPYNGYAGIARIEEERGLTLAYRAPVAGLAAPQGQGLNDLYIRFFRIAERRIAGNAEGQGIISFISNNAWLDGLSHTTMRHHYLHTFQQIFIDNLNGDKYRTGKTTPEGKPDPSAFSTAQNREGIQVGTAIATLVRCVTPSATRQTFSSFAEGGASASALVPATADPQSIHLRDIWGASKLSHLQREANRESEPLYESLVPKNALGLPFADRNHSVDYTSWPRLPELFPFSSPGIKTSRDPIVVSIERDRLAARMDFYLDANNSDEAVREALPLAMKNATRFEGAETRRILLEAEANALRQSSERGYRLSPLELRRSMIDSRIKRYCYRPYDIRWIYWEMHTKLIDEKRDAYFHAKVENGFALISAQSNRKTYDPPCVTRSIAGLHVIEKGATVFPLQAHLPTLFHSNVLQDNLSNQARKYVETSKDIHHLFFHALAIMHTPAYRTENAGALLGDWPRIPLPATADLLAHSASLGHRLAELLDPESSINLSAEWSFLSPLKTPTPQNLAEDLKIEAGWGSRGQGSTVMPGRGLAKPREWTATERSRIATLAAAQSLTSQNVFTLLGETCLDIHLNGSTFWSAVPANVWTYTLGGYQVLKKWLSYRELSLLGRPLHPEEAAYFAQVVRRISAILLLGPELDASYAAILPTATGLPAARMSAS